MTTEDNQACQYFRVNIPEQNLQGNKKSPLFFLTFLLEAFAVFQTTHQISQKQRLRGSEAQWLSQ